MLDWEMAPHGSSPGRTYRYYIGKPLFEFGFGLSYTEFTLALEESTKLINGDNWRFGISIANTGNREGDDVLMAFYTPLGIPESEPASKLKF